VEALEKAQGEQNGMRRLRGTDFVCGFARRHDRAKYAGSDVGTSVRCRAGLRRFEIRVKNEPIRSLSRGPELRLRNKGTKASGSIF
jgi:hypothetical protein